MADEHDDWMSGLGVSISSLRQAASDAASAAVATVTDAPSASGPAPMAAAAAPDDTGSAPDRNAAVAAALPGAALAAAAPAPAASPGLLEEFEEGVISGVRTVEAAAPVVAEDAAATGLLATAAAAAGPVAVGAVIVGGIVVGAGLALGVPAFLQHADEEDKKTDPEEAKPEGGVSPTSGADGQAGQPIDPKEEVETAIHTGDWANAAELLNGFSADDISQRLAKLTPEQIAAIHDGALKNPRVGPQSQIAQMTAPQSSSGTGGDCNSLLQSIIDQLKLLEQLFEEATTDDKKLWQKAQDGETDPSGTTWSGHKKRYEEVERKKLQDRIKDWEDKCAGTHLDANQQEELEMAHDYAKKDFPEKPEYAK